MAEDDPTGISYTGTTAVTKDGKACERWLDMGHWLEELADGGEAAANYCRFDRKLPQS